MLAWAKVCEDWLNLTEADTQDHNEPLELYSAETGERIINSKLFGHRSITQQQRRWGKVFARLLILFLTIFWHLKICCRLCLGRVTSSCCLRFQSKKGGLSAWVMFPQVSSLTKILSFLKWPYCNDFCRKTGGVLAKESWSVRQIINRLKCTRKLAFLCSHF